MNLQLLAACCLLAAAVLHASADEKACCFSPTFTMDGRFTLTVNATDHRSHRFFNLRIQGALKSMADFPNKKFAAIGSFHAGYEAQKNKSGSANGTLTTIMSADGDTPRVYGKARFKGTSQNENLVMDQDLAQCMVSAVENTDRIPDYQCVPQQIFRGGDVKDGLIEMLPPDQIPVPEEIKNALKIFFDQATCTPSKISFHHAVDFRAGISAKISFDFEADSKVGHWDMPEIPDDVSMCRDDGVSRIVPADQVTGLLGLALAMSGIQQ